MNVIDVYFMGHRTTDLHPQEAAQMVKTAWDKVGPLYKGADGVFAVVTHTEFPITTDEFGKYQPESADWKAYQAMTREKFRYYDGPFFRVVSVLLKDMFVCDLMVSKWVIRGGKTFYVTFFGLEVNPRRPYTIAFDDDFWCIPEIKDVEVEMSTRLRERFEEYQFNEPTITKMSLPCPTVDDKELREIWAYCQRVVPSEDKGTQHIDRDPYKLDKGTGFFGAVRRFFFGKEEKNK